MTSFPSLRGIAETGGREGGNDEESWGGSVLIPRGVCEFMNDRRKGGTDAIDEEDGFWYVS